jgi:MscS family membrane protein
MFDLQDWLSASSPELAWIINVFVIVLATALVSFVGKRVLKKMTAKIDATHNRWDDIVLNALARPSSWVIWLVGLDIAADVIYGKTQSAIFTYSNSVRDVGILVCLTWFVLGIIRGAEQEFARNSDQLDKTTAQAIGKLLRLAVIITAALVILQTLGYSISGVLAMGGVGGIANRGKYRMAHDDDP